MGYYQLVGGGGTGWIWEIGWASEPRSLFMRLTSLYLAVRSTRIVEALYLLRSTRYRHHTTFAILRELYPDYHSCGKLCAAKFVICSLSRRNPSICNYFHEIRQSFRALQNESKHTNIPPTTVTNV